jgi:5-methyltetrahydropteroyltriglutamate--homocysteine methyltransferase
MRRSSDRALTTHVGSLCRSADIAEALRARDYGDGYEEAGFEKILRPAVADVVRRQVEVGVDVPSDGEFGKTSWMGYVSERPGGVQVLAVQDTGRLTAEVSKDMQARPANGIRE